MQSNQFHYFPNSLTFHCKLNVLKIIDVVTQNSPCLHSTYPSKTYMRWFYVIVTLVTWSGMMVGVRLDVSNIGTVMSSYFMRLGKKSIVKTRCQEFALKVRNVFEFFTI